MFEKEKQKIREQIDKMAGTPEQKEEFFKFLTKDLNAKIGKLEKQEKEAMAYVV